MREIVVDTNVLIAALRSGGGASRRIIRLCLEGQICPLFGNALWLEYEALVVRQEDELKVTALELREVLAAFAASGRWVSIYFGWRPNLRDEADNHLIELAIAGGAQWIVTHNVRDFRDSELNWPGIQVLTPRDFLEELR